MALVDPLPLSTRCCVSLPCHVTSLHNERLLRVYGEVARRAHARCDVTISCLFLMDAQRFLELVRFKERVG